MRPELARHGAALSLILAGCAPAAAAPATVVVSAPVAPPPVVPVAPPPAPVPRGLAAPGQEGCRLAAAARFDLRFAPDGPPFASLAGGTATVDLTTSGPRAGAVLRVQREGWSLHGIVAADEITPAPALPAALAGFLVPADTARFTWKGTAPGTITIAFKPDPELKAEPEARLGDTELPCGAVTLDPRHFDASTAAPSEPGERVAELPAGRPVPLSRLPDTPPIARLTLPADDVTVTLLERRGRHARIRRVQAHAVVYGWVPASAVKVVATSDLHDAFSNGDYGLLPSPPGPERVVRCRAELALVAEIGGERRAVGAIAAGTRVGLRGARGDLVPVVLPEALARVPDSALVGVLASHLAGCDAVAP
jgi:hypothetical protein